jgi:hypothetical protein
MSGLDLEKLRLLIPHWVEHNESHAAEFREWAGKAADAEKDILAAAEHIHACNHSLHQALERLGGPLEGELHWHDEP